MDFLLSGYGHKYDKSKTKAFKTLRGKLNSSYEIVEDGISTAGRRPYYDCLEIKGSTSKTSRAQNNQISLMFYKMTIEDCINVSSMFLDFALKLDHKKGSYIHPDSNPELKIKFVDELMRKGVLGTESANTYLLKTLLSSLENSIDRLENSKSILNILGGDEQIEKSRARAKKIHKVMEILKNAAGDMSMLDDEGLVLENKKDNSNVVEFKSDS
ncbi:MAG: hypothetical protein C0631_15705 [Sedimenticola sp.]|uniref:Uncharacterized protein n=2 Tax=Sedimenticola TaxID=349742 RepID=A0A558CX73_9GAMM|nr:hypothetical protein [Sedimenticola selenatireducens]PLY12897.1 MAG: hypothetical protein C0631_15705 [Sedimenticola sp.]TVO69723.1 hypothetical protein FHP88_17855 [Sedimenticola selenatireducens]TVT53371.1 MAG: hypothetical protein FHK82_12005 [Sedimenticola thiotaurini]TVT62209.1 MAG: hypothetical protein FHK78_15195 [Sedimenticola selenatireducens]